MNVFNYLSGDQCTMKKAKVSSDGQVTLSNPFA